MEYVGELDTVFIPNFINDIKVTEIASEAFLDKSNIISVTLPSNLEKIGAAAFKGCGFASIDLHVINFDLIQALFNVFEFTSVLFQMPSQL